MSTATVSIPATASNKTINKFRRAPTGAYWGNPTADEVSAIEAEESDDETAVVVRLCQVGDLAGALVPGFQLHAFSKMTPASSPVSNVNGEVPVQTAAKAPTAAKATTAVVAAFSALDVVRATVDLARGPAQFVDTAIANAKSLGLPVGSVDRAKLASAIGRQLGASRKVGAALNAKGGRSAAVESFDWQALAKLGLLTPLQATTLAACGAIAASVDKVRRARNASL